jgi:amino acid transporter
MRRGLWMIFRWPLLLALLSFLGLFSALIGDEFYDLLSWLSLGVPLLLVGVMWIRMRRVNPPRS